MDVALYPKDGSTSISVDSQQFTAREHWTGSFFSIPITLVAKMQHILHRFDVAPIPPNEPPAPVTADDSAAQADAATSTKSKGK